MIKFSNFKLALDAYLTECGADPVECTTCHTWEDITIADDLYLDSLDHVELIMWIEEETDCEISDEDANEFKTLGDIKSYLVKHDIVELD